MAGSASPPAPISRVNDERKARIRTFWDATWNRGDIAAIDAMLTPGYIRYSIDPDPRDREYVKESVLTLRAAFPDLHSDIDEMIAEGDKIVIRWTAVGTHLGPFLGFPATGTRITTSGVLISRFVEDRIAEEWATWNAMDVLRDLGVIRIL
jgi:steroid delta-isomerase-like uncharacterized protein